MSYPDDGSTPLSDPNGASSPPTANLRDAYGWPIVGGILDTGGGPRSVAEMLRPAPQWGLGAFGSVNPLPDASGLFGQGLANHPATLSGAGEPAATRSLSNPGILSDPDGVSGLSVPAFIDPQAWQDLHDMTLHGDPDAVEEMLRLPPPAATGPLGSMFAGRTAGANGGTAFGDPKAASFSAAAPQTDDLSQVSTPDLISMWVNHPDNPLFAQPAVPDRGDIVPAVWRGDADALNVARKPSPMGVSGQGNSAGNPQLASMPGSVLAENSTAPTGVDVPTPTPRPAWGGGPRLSAPADAVAKSKTAIDAYDKLLGLIRRGESYGGPEGSVADYDAIAGQPKDSGPDLSKLTVGQVNDAIAADGKARSAYQFKPETLAQVASETNAEDLPFDGDTQDMLAGQLAKDIGYQDYLEGKKSLADMMSVLSNKWTALQDMSGTNLHDRQGSNRAIIPTQEVAGTLTDAKKLYQSGITNSPSVPPVQRH